MFYWAQRVEIHTAQKGKINTTKESGEFDIVKKANYSDDDTDNMEKHKLKHQQKCRYCSEMHIPQYVQHSEKTKQDADI